LSKKAVTFLKKVTKKLLMPKVFCALFFKKALLSCFLAQKRQTQALNASTLRIAVARAIGRFRSCRALVALSKLATPKQPTGLQETYT
jgi:hypothetical protein